MKSPKTGIFHFRSGADGVLVAGGHLGDCHYLSGNYIAQNRVLLLQKVLEQLGLEPERLRLEWVSASEGDRFAMVIKDMTKEIKETGQSPLMGEGKTCG